MNIDKAPANPVRTAIGLDIGGTKIAGGVVAQDGAVLDLLEVSTPATGDMPGTRNVLRQIIDSLRDHHPSVAAIGAGAAGMVGYWLGVGIASVVNLLDVEIVVIGGGLVSAGELLLAPTRESFRGFLFGRSRRPLPAIVPARFGPGAGVVGAAALAFDQCDLMVPNGAG